MLSYFNVFHDVFSLMYKKDTIFSVRNFDICFHPWSKMNIKKYLTLFCFSLKVENNSDTVYK